MDTGYIYLSNAQKIDLYTNASYILTSFFDTISFSQIYPWHHSSRDFVVKINDNKIDLKLTTIKEYKTNP